jgi:hypothetical protein
MLDDIVHALHACRSEREFWRVHIKAENALTPLEIAALIKFSHRLPRASQLWLEGLTSLGGFDAEEPPRFCRQPLAPHIDFYRDPFVPCERKQLIFGFCGAANRLMMPISCVLQHLPADACDLVLLRDPAKLHYIFGIPPYADSLAALARRLAEDFAAERYRRTVCYGTSMGGFVALQCGILMQADAAISIGGRFAWHPPRLLREPTQTVPGFDPLCACNAATATELVCYHSANRVDAEDATLLARIVPAHRIALHETSEHNIVLALCDQGRLKDFYADVFEFSGSRTGAAAGGTMMPAVAGVAPGARRAGGLASPPGPN